MNGNTERGKYGEDIALEFLLKKGYAYRARNYRAGRCEIDLILMDGGVLVFAEVKLRSGSQYGRGREAVNLNKQRNIIKAAQVYAAENGLTDVFMRFDVIEIELNSMTIIHIKDAFRADQ